MQQRFCSCGCTIWVEYGRPNSGPQIFFRLSDKSQRVFLFNCPSCRRHLSIDELA
jgi:hypothetical protein